MDSIRVSEAPDTGSIPVEATNFSLDIFAASSLKYKSTIQKATAVLLMLVFLISIAPKVYFHDIVADHKDFSDCQQLHHSTVLHQQGVACHFDELVVTSPFISSIEKPVLSLHFYFQKWQPAVYSLSLSSSILSKESRGPPSV